MNNMAQNLYAGPPRRPTPSHDAAHVLVSFQSNVPSAATHRSRTSLGRPLSTANLSRPPQNRRRVWRACESCRRKKIKCDAGDPCQCCVDTGSECVYAIEGYRREFESKVIEGYGKRIQALEDLVATLLAEQQRLAAQLTLPDSRLPPDSQMPVAINLIAESTQSPVGVIAQDRVDIPEALVIDPGLVGQPQSVSVLCPPEGSALSTQTSVKAASLVYRDDHGALVNDEADGAQYFGLGATVAVVDECPGLRIRIQQGLMQKGRETLESLFTEKSLPPASSRPGSLPPAPLMDALIDTFFRKVYRLFPIIEAEDFQRQYLLLLSNNAHRPGFLALLYSILAVSSPHMTQDDGVWSREGCSGYKGLDLGRHFHKLALSTGQLNAFTPFGSNNVNTVTALTLLGMHLAQTARMSEAWSIISHAVRLGYEMGLHRSPKQMGLPLIDVKRRCQLWWCLYVMDRLLALHLGRPLAIHDSDSDVFFPSPRPRAPGFVAMTHLCRLIGQIHGTVNSISNAHKWHDEAKHMNLRTELDALWADLRQWRETMLPGLDPEESKQTERCVLVSTYCSAVHLLFRPFLSTPHRPSRWDAGLAVRESLAAATECVHLTPAFNRVVPACHYYAFHGQNLFVSVLSVLHCIRNREAAVAGVGEALDALSAMGPKWPLAPQYRAVADEYHAVTTEVIDGGHTGRCMFENHGVDPGSEAAQFDPWINQIDLEGNLFPSMPDMSWMNELFSLSPGQSGADAEDKEPPRKRRKTKSRASVCSFSVRKSTSIS